MPDDAMFRTFAREHRLKYRWRTRREGDRYYAEIEVVKDGERIYQVATNCLSTEQDVLNTVMKWAIQYITEELKPEVIVGFGLRGRMTSP